MYKMKRPFYSTFAWAYDLLIQGPVEKRIDFIVMQLLRQRVVNGARLLDAGCGSGTYALAMAQKGFQVIGIDSSADLIVEAKRKSSVSRVSVEFMVGDILRLPEGIMVEAVLCRGVLNDLVETEFRKAVFPSFAGAMGNGGVLVLDVREWQSTVVRKTENPVFEKTVMTQKGQLTFRSITELRPETHSLLISETHVLQSPNGRNVVNFDFEMKCWTQTELTAYLTEAGFEVIEYFGDYDSAKPVGATDRLVAVAILKNKAKAQRDVLRDRLGSR